MGRRSSRRDILQQRCEGLDSAVSLDLSRGFTRRLRRIVTAAQAGKLDDLVVFAPGRYIPVETSILDTPAPALPPEPELQIEEIEATEPEVEPVVEEMIEPEVEVKPEPEPEPAPAPEVSLDGVIDLDRVRGPKVEVIDLEEAEAVEPEPEVEDEVEEEIDHAMLDELARFAREAERGGLSGGIQDLDIRRSLGQLPSDELLMQALLGGDLEGAKRLILDRRLTVASMAQSLDRRLTKADTSEIRLPPMQGVLHQLEERLGRTRTESIRNLPRDLHAANLSVKAQRRAHDEAAEAFDDAAEKLTQLSRPITSALADLGQAHEHRHSLREPQKTLMELLDRGDALAALLSGNLARCDEAVERLDELGDESMQLSRRAREHVNRQRQLMGSAKLLGATIPSELDMRVGQEIEQLERLVREALDSLDDLDTPVMDAQLEQAKAGLEKARADARHMSKPIRPSVFRRKTSRDEELRRLVLIACHVITHKRTERGTDIPVRGFGKRTITEQILVLSNLIDESESERCVSFLERLAHHGNVWRELHTRFKAQGVKRVKRSMVDEEMLRECGEVKMIEHVRLGKGWYYRPTEEGHEQAMKWLAECQNAAHVRSLIDSARKKYTRQRFANRGKK